MTERRPYQPKPTLKPRFLRRSRQDFTTFSLQPAGLIDGFGRIAGRRLRLPETLSAHRLGHGPGLIDDLVSTPPPNLRVAFVLQEMAHQVVSGGGVPQSYMSWNGQSPVATAQNNGPYSLPAPGPGETWAIDHANGIYTALVESGCQSPMVNFPVTMNSAIVEGEETEFGVLPTGPEIGSASPTDTDTITVAGFYLFSYTVRATSGAAVSDFSARGIVAVRCVSDTSLD